MKDSQRAIIELSAEYQKLPNEERLVVDDLLAEWVGSDDERLRFDAMAIINDFQIDSAVPALQVLEEQLSDSSAPGAPYERAKARRLIDALRSGKPS